MTPLTVKQLGAELKVDTYANALTWATQSEAEATRKFQIIDHGQLADTRTLLELFGLYLPNIFAALEVANVGHMGHSVLGSMVVFLAQIPASPPLSRFIREQKDPRRVPNLAIVHLASRVPPVDFIFEGLSPPNLAVPGQAEGYTGFHALNSFSHHLEFAVRAIHFSFDDSLVWKPDQFKKLLNHCMGNLSDIADFLNGRRVASQVGTLSSDWLGIWKECAGKGGARKCVKLADGEEMSACSRCRSVRYCGGEHQKKDWDAHKLICCKQGKSWDEELLRIETATV